MLNMRLLILTIAFLTLPVSTTFAQKKLVNITLDKQEADQKEEIPIVMGLGSWHRSQVDSVVKRQFRTGVIYLNAPVVLISADEASKYFKKDVVAKWAKKINFDKQMIFVWSWRGSGQDRMEPYISQADPKKVLFYNEQGSTKDLSEHLYVYAVRKDIKMPGVDVPALLNLGK